MCTVLLPTGVNTNADNKYTIYKNVAQFWAQIQYVMTNTCRVVWRVSGRHHFEGTCRLHLQGNIKPSGSNFLVNYEAIPHSVTSHHRAVDRSPSVEHIITRHVTEF